MCCCRKRPKRALAFPRDPRMAELASLTPLPLEASEGFNSSEVCCAPLASLTVWLLSHRSASVMGGYRPQAGLCQSEDLSTAPKDSNARAGQPDSQTAVPESPENSLRRQACRWPLGKRGQPNPVTWRDGRVFSQPADATRHDFQKRARSRDSPPTALHLTA